jgi:hypothetical protein
VFGEPVLQLTHWVQDGLSEPEVGDAACSVGSEFPEFPSANAEGFGGMLWPEGK